ncbi:MAG: c-type cytochrome [Myxococcales bacterium]|nr:c-type cytochrome [Myxococcales bacterium]
MRKGLLLAAMVVGACNGKFGDAGPIPEPLPLGPRPDYGPTIQAATPPPPISGGTLHVTTDGRFAVASDPDRDRVSLVDLTSFAVRHVAFEAGAEPGRVVEDASGRVHVVLRRKGEIATIDPAGATLVERRAVCPVPRGLAADGGRLLVACAGGELVELPVAAGSVAKVLMELAPDLRDVVVDASSIYVSTFRAAEVFVLKKTSTSPTAPRILSPVKTLNGVMTPAVAWRMRPVTGGVAIVHQVGADPDGKPISTEPGGYAGGGSGGGDGTVPGTDSGVNIDDCVGSIVQSTVSIVSSASGMPSLGPIPKAVLPVDFAEDGSHFVVAAAGNGKTRGLGQLFHFSAGVFSGPCVKALPIADPPGQSVALTFSNAKLVVQTREPAAIHLYGADLAAPPVTIPLATDSREDTGHTIFHSNSGGFLACASCHPEGGDDGRTWTFEKLGPRRTQSFRGGFLETAPFHWDGDMPDLRALSEAVLSKRMSGPHLDDGQLGALSAWLDAVPALPKPTVTKGSVEAGAALFTARGCATCHAGSATTTNATVDVGTGGNFQVPSLRGLFYRAPYMHDGCTNTLAARFTAACAGGDKHGRTSGLSGAQIQDLVAYLSSL